MNHQSKRFNPSKWAERLVPILLALIVLGLVVTLAIILLAVLHLTPSF